MGRVMDHVANNPVRIDITPSSVTIECHSSGDSSEKVSSNEVASRSIPANAASMSIWRGSGSSGEDGDSPRSAPGCVSVMSSINLIPKRTSRTWSVYSAIDHWPSTGRRSRSSELRPATALAKRVGRPAMAARAEASVHSLPLNPHSSHCSKSTTPSILPAISERRGKRRSTCPGAPKCLTHPA